MIPAAAAAAGVLVDANVTVTPWLLVHTWIRSIMAFVRTWLNMTSPWHQLCQSKGHNNFWYMGILKSLCPIVHPIHIL